MFWLLAQLIPVVAIAVIGVAAGVPDTCFAFMLALTIAFGKSTPPSSVKSIMPEVAELNVANSIRHYVIAGFTTHST